MFHLKRKLGRDSGTTNIVSTYVCHPRKRVGELTRLFYMWPLAIYRADYKKIKDVNGLDAYFYVRFLRMMARVLLPIWIFSWIVLIPLVSVNSEVDGRTGLDKLSFGNVAQNRQARYSGHLIMAWFFTCTSVSDMPSITG
jgi:calcium permeable stress-gated cation channel